jgi:hypothetical protein
MATYRIHTYLSGHEGQKSGQVRSCTPGARIEDVPPGEFADLQPGRDYSRLDDDDGGSTETADTTSSTD